MQCISTDKTKLKKIYDLEYESIIEPITYCWDCTQRPDLVRLPTIETSSYIAASLRWQLPTTEGYSSLVQLVTYGSRR